MTPNITSRTTDDELAAIVDQAIEQYRLNELEPSEVVDYAEELAENELEETVEKHLNERKHDLLRELVKQRNECTDKEILKVLRIFEGECNRTVVSERTEGQELEGTYYASGWYWRFGTAEEDVENNLWPNGPFYSKAAALYDLRKTVASELCWHHYTIEDILRIADRHRIPEPVFG